MADDYVDVALEANADPDTLRERGLDVLRAGIADYEPADGNLEVIVLDATAEMAADREAMLVDVTRAIFRVYGREVVGLEPNEALPAHATSTWTMRDAVGGYSIPAGSRVAIGDTTFETVDSVTVPAGTTTLPGVVVQAIDEFFGAAANGLTDDVTLLEPYAFVASVTLNEATYGGQDAEAEDEFEARTARALRHVGRPTVPDDFADRALDFDAVGRALAIDGLAPGTNEQQTVKVTSATGGTFTLTYSGQTTAAIAYNATAAAVQTALEALSNIDPGDVLVAGTTVNSAAGVTVTFSNRLRWTNVAAMTSTSSLTGTGAAVAVTTPVSGVAPLTNQARTITLALAGPDGLPVDAGTKSDVAASLAAQREANWNVYVVDPAYTTVGVTATVTVWSTYDPADVLARAATALTDFLDPATWGQPPSGDAQTWHDEPNVYLSEVVAALNAVEGLRRVVSLNVNGVTDFDLLVPLTGTAGLPLAGTMSVTQAP